MNNYFLFRILIKRIKLLEIDLIYVMNYYKINEKFVLLNDEIKKNYLL